MFCISISWNIFFCITKIIKSVDLQTPYGLFGSMEKME